MKAFRTMARAARNVRDDEGAVLPAVSATAFPVVVWGVSGVSAPCLIPLFAVASLAWWMVLKEATRRRERN